MVIYLRHDKHGTKVAISELEAKQDEKNGWKRYDPTVLTSSPDNRLVNIRGKHTRG